MKNKKRNLFRAFIRWGLGIHGAIHVVETAINMYEQAWISASLSAFIAFIMIAGAFIKSCDTEEE
tara:strand:- start:516 stop:710 length:195 start_codon:yes stop_codon:yes gene_type:complete